MTNADQFSVFDERRSFGLLYASNANGGILTFHFERKHSVGAGLDFNLTVDEFEWNRLLPFPDLAVVEFEAVASNPFGDGANDPGLFFPFLINGKVGQAEAFENALFPVRFDWLVAPPRSPPCRRNVAQWRH
jgi:hypothetical protein